MLSCLNVLCLFVTELPLGSLPYAMCRSFPTMQWIQNAHKVQEGSTESAYTHCWWSRFLRNCVYQMSLLGQCHSRMQKHGRTASHSKVIMFWTNNITLNDESIIENKITGNYTLRKLRQIYQSWYVLLDPCKNIDVTFLCK